ncbi:hypothetical protein A6F68_01545 [Tsuneonella dongtanensis]|uniref:DUF1800 domain-containing protein n=1 Tax=Tsuneonella dongtanensis TaxID=692370 RepID=A0A1B2AD25_9SPHN|nr:DUF1800 domain-containing protein [Tsuneonella dongtanensis]ANY20059.1 hypothetical protein A6F68_01545 [Tsuneonella dongtanensis]
MRDEVPEAADSAGADDNTETPEETGSSPTKGLAVSSLALAAAACGGGGGGGGSGGGIIGGIIGGGTPAPTVLKPQTDAEAARFILHASIAASTAAIADVKSQGYEPWLNAQMSLGNDQSAEAYFIARGYDAVDANQYYNSSGIADRMIWKQLMNGNSGVRKRVALALSEFFVVSLTSVNITWRSQAMGYYWDTLNEHAFGNFRDLLEAITLNPAMGVFLNTLGNRKADPSTGRVADENFGREVMQLFTIGLFELNPDGSLKGGGTPVETYTNADVTGIAKAFTGYDYDYTGVTFASPPGSTAQIQSPRYVRQPMTADPSKWRRPSTTSQHSDEAKTFLGTTVPAGTSAAATLKQTLDTLFNHPNVGPFFARQMIQRLVTSNPSAAYVQRVAAAFANNGSGARGDLRAVFKAILLDDEALSPTGLTDLRFGKLREPILRFAQWGRTFGAASASGDWALSDMSDTAARLGQSPLRSPSVFNFFRPGYVPLNSSASAANLLAPEFQLVNESTVASYVNFMERTVDGTGGWMSDVKATYAGELAIAHDAPALLDRIDLLLTGKQLSQGTRDTILAAMQAETVTEASDEATKRRRIHIGVLLAMASNNYLVQK